MFRGFYTLTSSMMTQQTNLNVISNNMANTSTPGFKKSKLIVTTFSDMVLSRTGNTDKSNTAPLNGAASMVTVPDETVVNHTRGFMDQTGRGFDFALNGEGFFEIQTPDEGMVYTRNGSFSLDDQGYLYLQHIGRVMGDDGEPILIGTDKFKVSRLGEVTREDGTPLGNLHIVDFADYGQLETAGEGMFQNQDAQNMTEVTPSVQWKMLERSNVEAIDEMTAMIISQRAIQSSGQIVKMYDNLMNKAVNDIGRI